MRHKHADLIHAWAEGAEIQVKVSTGEWIDQLPISFPHGLEVRIKPTPKPDFHTYCYIDRHVGYASQTADRNCKFTFDGETGKLKSAEVLK